MSEISVIIPVHPGELIREEYMPAFGMDVPTLATLMDIMQSTAKEILDCKRPISQRNARKLGSIFGTSSQYWIKLQEQYDAKVSDKVEVAVGSPVLKTEPEDYKFKSEITSRALPTGYTHLSDVSRDEVPGFLDRITGTAEKKGSDWIALFASSRTKNTDTWTAESIKQRLDDLGADIEAIKGKLRQHSDLTVEGLKTMRSQLNKGSE